MAEALVLGFECKVYFNDEVADGGAGTIAVPVWLELDELADATLNIKFNEADSATRGTNGIDTKEPGLLAITVEGTVQWRADNENISLMLAKCLGRDAWDLLILTGSRTDPLSKGVRGDFKITSFPRKEALGDVVTHDLVFTACNSFRANNVVASTGVAP